MEVSNVSSPSTRGRKGASVKPTTPVAASPAVSALKSEDKKVKPAPKPRASKTAAKQVVPAVVESATVLSDVPAPAPAAVPKKSAKKTVAAVQGDTVVPAAKPAKESRKRPVKSENADAAKPKRPLPRRILAAPMSPTATTLRLADPESHLSFQDVRKLTNDVTKSISRLVSIASEVGRNGKVELPEGTSLNNKDVDRMTARVIQAIRVIPGASRRSSRRVAHALSDAERAERVKSLVAKTEQGLNALNYFLKNKNAVSFVLESETKRISSLKTPPKSDAGDQISSAFYISDPLREFFTGANLGNGIALFYPGQCSDATRAISGAADPKAAVEAVSADTGRDPYTDLGAKQADVHKLADPCNIIGPLVIERGIATSPLLMAMMSLYILANGLKTADGRIRIDDRMRRYFGSGSTRWVVNGVDLTTQALAAGVDVKVPYDQCGLDRLASREAKKVGDAKPCDGETFTRAMSITLASYYRACWINPDMTKELSKDGVRNLAYGVKSVI